MEVQALFSKVRSGETFDDIEDTKEETWERLAAQVVQSLLELSEAEPFIKCSEVGPITWDRIDEYPGLQKSPTDLTIIQNKLE